TRSKTEVVLLITPRILRATEVLPPDQARFAAGTLGEGGAAPLLLDAGSSELTPIVTNPTAAEVEAGALATQNPGEGGEAAPPQAELDR
ncbi:MAG: hypothetical protein EBT54_04785, partial [Betaproteobacteria bacterium]|nr:hypothetical protein [Betaproteobacteria bacterium]